MLLGRLRGFHLPYILLCGTSPTAASVKASPIRDKWRATPLGASPAFATTWRSAPRASVYLQPLTSLPHRYDDRGGAFRQCRITRQQFHERDGAAACFYPGLRPPGVVARAHNNRPLLGLVAFMASKRTWESPHGRGYTFRAKGF